jgi:hypothetical protein
MSEVYDLRIQIWIIPTLYSSVVTYVPINDPNCESEYVVRGLPLLNEPACHHSVRERD